MFCSVGDLPQEDPLLSKAAEEGGIYSQASTVCRYYTAGDCRRGSSCRFMHPAPLVSVQQEHPYAEGLGVQQGTQYKEWHQNIIHGFTAFPTYAGPQSFSASGDVLDNFSDFSSSNDSAAASDQSLSTTFKLMAIKGSVPSEPEPFYQSEFSQYPNNTITRYGNVAYPGYYRGDIPTGSNARGPSRKADATRKKCIAYKTKPCKFFSANKTCAQGDKCTFIHDAEKVRRGKLTNSQDRATKLSHLPPKPRSLLDDSKARDFYPVTWRVIGGGVMMGGYRPPCKAFAAGYCPDGADCKLAHETELQDSANGVVPQPPSREGSPCAQPSLASSASSKRRRVSMEHSGSYRAVRDTYGGISGDKVPPSGCEDEEEPKQSNTKNAASSQHRRTRSMSLPSSPSILRAPHIFAEL